MGTLTCISHNAHLLTHSTSKKKVAKTMTQSHDLHHCLLCPDLLFNLGTIHNNDGVMTIRMQCDRCSYSLFLFEDRSVECEFIRVGNICLGAYRAPGHSQIWKLNEEGSKWIPISNVSITELTPELAKYWSNKMRVLGVFQ